MQEPVEEEPPPFVDPQEAREARRMRIAIGGFGTVLFATLVVSMHLSTLELSFGTLVYGSSQVWRGHDAHFRVLAADPRGNMRPVPITGGRVTLRDRQGERETVTLTGPLGEVSLPIPSDLDDAATLEVVVRTEHGEDHFEQTVRAVDTPPRVKPEVVSHRELLAKRGRPGPGSEYELRLYPRAGVLVDGLENSVWGWIVGADTPTVVHSDSPSFRAETDEAGLFQFRWLPRPSVTGYRFTLGEAPAITRSVNISNEQRQLVAETEPSAFARPGTDLTLVVRTLPVREPLFIDLWLGNTLPYAVSLPASGGRLETSIPLPPTHRGLARVDVYRSIFAPEHSSSSVYLWVSDASAAQASDEAMGELSGLSGSDPAIEAARVASGPARERFAEMALSRVVAPRVGHRLLRTTVEERNAAVEEKRRRARSAVNTLFVLTFALALALATAWGIRHHLQVRRQVREVMEDGIASGEDIDRGEIEGLTRVRDLYDFALVLAALILAAYSTLILLQTIRWE